MRRSYFVCIALAATTVAAHAETPPPTLSAREIEEYFAPYAPAVKSCYAVHARGKAVTGALRLELIIHPSGDVFRFGFSAPGVAAPPLGRLDACLRKLVTDWHFPVRSRFTTAVIPFLFQRTFAPDAGPIESCWEPRGCPPGTREDT